MIFKMKSWKYTSETLEKRLHEVHSHKYDYDKFVVETWNNKSIIICPTHGEFSCKLNNHIMGKGCPKCKGRNLSSSEKIDKLNEVHNFGYDYSMITIIKNKSPKLQIICSNHGIFYQTYNNHLQGQGCPSCRLETIGRSNKSNLEEFLKKAKEVHGDRYDYSKYIYESCHKPSIIICEEHGEFLQNANNHLQGQNCAYCSGNGKVTTEIFIKRSIKIHNVKYDYIKTVYTKSENKLCIVCKKHGDFWMLPGNHLKGQGCPSCRSSTGEKMLEDILTKRKISFFTRYNKFEDCRNPLTGYKLIFDAYLPEHNICIEIDGPQHFGISFKNFHLSETQLNDIKFRDEVKNEYCKTNKIILIRISYKDFSKMEEILNEYFMIKEH